MAKSKQQSSNNNLTPARRAVVAHLVMALLLLYCQSIPSGYCFYWPAAGRGLVNGGAGGIRVDPFLKSIHLFNDLTMMTRVAPYYSTTTTISAIDRHQQQQQQRQRQRQLSYSKNVYINKTTSHTTVTVSLISTTTVSTSQFCARFVGVVGGGCRRRRRQLDALPMEEEEEEDDVDVDVDEMAAQTIQPDKVMLNR